MTSQSPKRMVHWVIRGFGRDKTRKGIRGEGSKATPLSNYAYTSSRSGKEVADLEGQSVTADPLAGVDNDKF